MGNIHKDNKLPRMYEYYADLDEIRVVDNLLDDYGDDKRGRMPAILKAAKYGRYGMFSVAETGELGEAGSPCEKMTFAVLDAGKPVFIAKGLMMTSSVALAQAKEGIDIGSKRDYKTLYEAAMSEISGLNESDREAVLKGEVPLGYDSLIFDKIMAEESDESERILLVPYVQVTRDYMDNYDTINDALHDFCDFAKRRIVVISSDFELEESVESEKFRSLIAGFKGQHIKIDNGVLMLV